MEIIRGLYNLRDYHRGCVATIGNFDGVHLGHQQVLSLVRQQAGERQLPSTVILFEPQPLEFVAPDKAPRRITRFREKIRLLHAQGIDRVVCLPFNAGLQNLTAQTFIQRLLVDGLGVAHFVVGDDFRFGRQRQGDFALLQDAGAANGFSVQSTPSCCYAGVRVSSTAIRQALQSHDLATAAKLLGRPFDITGKVAKGRQLGRTLGVPTANIRLQNKQPALQGVYATRVFGWQDRIYEGVANIGYRPTIAGLKPQLEVHIFDLQADLYGCQLRVEFCHFIRAEQKFADLSALQQQINQDIAAAKAFFAVAEN
ncbi:MAG: bifunctional riboflavin kinase/FAD synthetase [Gammaproteobacteria bacterium]|jgi:riboflavin kinase/FMN adenylyltransferase|nr:bifunctional riboflavin kinase/FAD synthetase [Gammaproteobacteria bacterium]